LDSADPKLHRPHVIVQRRTRQLPRHPQDERETGGAQGGFQQRHPVHRLRGAKADKQHHYDKTERHTQEVRHRAAQTEIHARRHEHHVVRPRRDRRHEGKAAQGDEHISAHVRGPGSAMGRGHAGGRVGAGVGLVIAGLRCAGLHRALTHD
jgi:hypothetical protein